MVDIVQQVQNRARQLIEEVMIATNGCTARYLAAQSGVSLRRVVRSPERWLRIVAVARAKGLNFAHERRVELRFELSAAGYDHEEHADDEVHALAVIDLIHVREPLQHVHAPSQF